MRDGTPTWASFEVGLVVSRQNGKGSILEARELAGLFLFDERLIIHSAHQFDTSLEAFRRIKELVESKAEFTRRIKKIIHNHGEEGIELMNGNRLRFRTRTKGGGRGFTGDCLILDEAMYLPAETMRALMPVLSARPNPQLWYTGSAGDKDSTQLGRVRQRGINGQDPRLTFLEWSIEPCTELCGEDCDEHDPVDSVRSYAKSNPGLGIRISLEHVEAERRSMDPEGFSRERLGVGDWPVEGESWRIIDEESWLSAIDPVSEPKSPLVFALDVTRDRTYAAIVVAGLNGEGKTHIEIPFDGTKLDHRRSTGWVIKRLTELNKRWKPAHIIIDKGSPAGVFFDELEGLGMPVLAPTVREYAQACGWFYMAAMKDRSLVHCDQVPLKTAVAGAEKRELADLWAWDKRSSAVDISPLVAATLACWGLNKVINKPKPQPMFAWG